MGAYLTGVMVTSGPWLLTSAVLMSLRVAARQGSADFLRLETIVTVVYAVTIVLGAPVQVVLSRYAADRLYDGRVESISAPLRRALAGTLVAFGAVGILLMLMLGAPLVLAVPGAILTVVVGAQWLMLSMGGGLSSPGVVLKAFAFGAPLTAGAALGLERGLGLGATGYLYGFVLGQLLTLVLLLVGVIRALPAAADESARLWPAFGEYRLLAISSFAYHLSIWADKVVIWLVADRAIASLYTATTAMAWFAVIPGFAWMYVQMETVFYQRFRAYYGAVTGGGSLAALRERAEGVRIEALNIVRGTALVQAGVTVVALLAAPQLMRGLDLPATAVPIFRIALLGAALQVTALLAILLLYYFDLRREALAVSLTLLLGEVLFTLVGWKAGLPVGAGYALACAAACGMGIWLIRRRLNTLLIDTFQAQPYGAM